MSDLRGFLAQVRQRRPSDLLVVERQVSPTFETTAILTKLEERRRSPILLFADVAGTTLPVVTNVCGSMGRLATALGCRLPDVSKHYDECSRTPIEPRVVADGPVHGRVEVGAAVDLGCLPAMVYHQDDAGQPYITAGIGVARDPEDGHVNLSFHRLMIHDRSSTGIFMEPGKDLDRIYQKYWRRGAAMPIAFFLGSHPVWALGALYSGPQEEYSVIGGLLGQPLEVVRCVTQPDLCVPARAEITLEGSVAPEGQRQEGPFGEWPGYSTGAAPRPVFRVEAMTRREGAMFQDVVSGHMEHLILELPAIESRILRNARAVVPGVSALSLPAPFTLVVAVAKTSDTEPRLIMDALLSSDIQAKHVIVVDEDVDARDLRAVSRAIGLNVQPTMDVHIYPDEQGTALDPSCVSDGARTSKMGIDATRRLARRSSPTPNRVPQDILDSVDVDALLGRTA